MRHSLFAISDIFDAGNTSHNENIPHLEKHNPFYENPILHSAHRKLHGEE